MSRTKIGIVGCGNISDIYLKSGATFDVLEVVACADLITEQAQEQAAKYDVPKACSTAELLADPKIWTNKWNPLDSIFSIAI